MENLMMDFYDHPGFVQELFEAIADYNISQVNEALRYEIDAVYFGDDWGQQRGLQMGRPLWREKILPHLRRMYGTVRDAGKYVMIHSDGDVDELFDDLIDAGVNCYNPFQPEVMDVDRLLPSYRGRLCFHGRPVHPEDAALRHARAGPERRFDACWSWVLKVATSSRRPTTSRATCRWRTCSP